MARTIGLWGRSEAGKTALLYQLCTHVTQTGWQVFPNEAARPFLENAASLAAQNRFPQPTALGTRAQVVYDLCSPQGQSASIHVTDKAGEELEELSDEVTAELNSCDGLLLLFDCMEPRSQLQTGLKRLLNSLHMARQAGAARNPKPIAICLTKADRLMETEADMHLAIEQPARFVSERIDPALAVIAETRLSCFQLFPVSAAGVFVKEGALRSATFFDESLSPRLATGGRAINLTAPIAFLLEGRY
ncbi:MAG: GTPase domain-containing protein [Bryobacterales bacterium]|nr:GTPase domain-containing protein [Bryobacterales bacterium]